MVKGKIVFLNGTSSSGKTSIARELLQVLDAPYLHMPLDTFVAMRTPRDIGKKLGAIVFERTVKGFHHAIAAMAGVGNNLIVDHVLREPPWLHECVTVLAPFEVVFVGVHCALAELERRERARGDRMIGIAAWQFERVHAHHIYDVECDTSIDSALDCALHIKDIVQDGPPPRVFIRLRELLE
jgi:chloramphenicol 3-O phosphotransferase